MNFPARALFAGLLLLGALQLAHAEPYLAVRHDQKCNGCHVNPTGGGLRNDFGLVFGQTALPAHPKMDPANWNGKIGEMLKLGGDLRASFTANKVPEQSSGQEFGLDQVRLYANVSLMPDKLAVYVDQQVAPGTGETQEAYLRYGNPSGGVYVKGGKFYLPFGWRLQDSTAFVKQTTGISMTTPDIGVELGYEAENISAQLAVTQGVGNAGQNSGHQTTAQFIWFKSIWRMGAAASFIDSELGDRRMGGLFAGLHTGPIAWLAEADLIRDEGFPLGTRSLAAGLAEANWAIRTGHNLKFTAEFFEPDRDVDEDEQNRWSVVYELTPMPFVQLRMGHRRYDGIPQNSLQNRRLTFVELHGFF